MTVQYPNDEVLFSGDKEQCLHWVKEHFSQVVYQVRVYADRMVVDVIFW